VPGSIPELTLAQCIRGVDKVQLMSGMRELKYFSEPGTLRPRVAGKVESD